MTLTIDSIQTDQADGARSAPALESYVQEVWAGIAAGTLEPHEYLILHAPGNSQQVMMLTAAICLNRGLTPDELRGPEDLPGAPGSKKMRLLPGLMEFLQRERPEYVTAIGKVLSDLEARWDEVKAEFINAPLT